MLTWFRVLEKKDYSLYFGGGASSSFGERNFDYSKWMAGLRFDVGQQYLRLGYRHYNFVGNSNQGMVFFTIGTAF